MPEISKKIYLFYISCVIIHLCLYKLSLYVDVEYMAYAGKNRNDSVSYILMITLLGIFFSSIGFLVELCVKLNKKWFGWDDQSQALLILFHTILCLLHVALFIMYIQFSYHASIIEGYHNLTCEFKGLNFHSHISIEKVLTPTDINKFIAHNENIYNLNYVDPADKGTQIHLTESQKAACNEKKNFLELKEHIDKCLDEVKSEYEESLRAAEKAKEVPSFKQKVSRLAIEKIEPIISDRKRLYVVTVIVIIIYTIL